MSVNFTVQGLLIYIAMLGFVGAFALALISPLRRIAQAFYGMAFVASICAVVWRGASVGHVPMQNMFEFLLIISALIPLLTVLSYRMDGERSLSLDAALAAFVLFPCGFILNGEIRHLAPALQSALFVPHVGAYALGYIILMRAAFGVGTRLVPVGFFLITLGLVLGAVWGKLCWGEWWQFDPKEMWSLATWFVYAAYFHFHQCFGESFKQLDRLLLIFGAIMIVLTLAWINFSRFFIGIHSYA